MIAAIRAYRDNSGLVLRYTGRFNFASITDPCTQWQRDDAAIVEIKDKQNITIEGADGSGANFGIKINGTSQNIIIRNMTMGLLPGSVDILAIEQNASRIWVHHNTLFSSLRECDGAGDLEFDGAFDTKNNARDVTFSFNYVHSHQKVGVLGGAEGEVADRRHTFHHNYYRDVYSRLPRQRAGVTHMYSNLYSGVLRSGINVNVGGFALIESNYFENVTNPVTSRGEDPSRGFWDLRNNNITSPADFTRFGITWERGRNENVFADAQDWRSSGTFPIGIPYSYTPSSPACVKRELPNVAGAGRGMRMRLNC